MSTQNTTLINCLKNGVHYSEHGSEFVNICKDNKKLIKQFPKKFLLIPSMTHDQHHEVMQAFLKSRWSADLDRRKRAESIYYPRRSIGAWLKEIDDDKATGAYKAYKDEAQLHRAEAWLRRQGLKDYKWT